MQLQSLTNRPTPANLDFYTQHKYSLKMEIKQSHSQKQKLERICHQQTDNKGNVKEYPSSRGKKNYPHGNLEMQEAQQKRQRREQI